MVLTAEQRLQIVKDFMKYKSDHQETLSISYGDLVDAIGAIDDWLEEYKSALENSSTPTGNQALSDEDKIRIISEILETRADTQY